MNPLLSIMTLLATLRTDLYTKFNAAMKKAEPLEQFEAGSAARGILNEIDWAQERLKRTGEELQASLDNAGKFLSSFAAKPGEDPEMAATRFLAEFTAKVEQDAITAAITAKTVVPFTDHENAITAARETATNEAKEAAEADFNSKLKTIELLAERRKDAVTRVGELAAASITDEVLAGDKHEEVLTAIEGRITKLKEKNITADGRPKIYADLIAKADDASFDAGLDLILEAAGGQLAAVAATPPPAPKVDTKDGKTPLAAGTGERKKAIC